MLAGPGYVASLWKGLERRLGVRAELVDGEGSVLIGESHGTGPRVVRPAVIGGLPRTLRVAGSDPTAESAASLLRRRLLLGGFGVLALVLLTGSYFIVRSIGRELAVARLQSEFVSAVSHEFLTPLTSLRQLSEMLEKGRIERDEQKQQSYSILARESERLQRLVESLLDFGRMEAGVFRYRFREVDPSALLTEVVAEFRGEATTRCFEIDLADPGGLPPISADPEALKLALWNLLDNAVKYSPESRTVWVDTMRTGDRVAIRVRDRGQGIPHSEQKKIFGRFVRGEAARSGSIKGTGIGLALVRHIVEAHRGEIRVASTPGEGSIFTMLLPTEKIT